MRRFVWSTVGVPPAEQRSAWEHAAGEAWVPVTVAAGGADSGCPSQVHALDLGGVTVSRLATCPQRVTRHVEQLAAEPGDKVFLNMPLTEGSYARTAGNRTAGLDPGDFVVFDGAKPFELTFTRPLRQVSLAIRHDDLLPRLSDPAGSLGARVPGDAGVGAFTAAAIRGLGETAGTLDRRAARDVADRIVDLVALALGSVVRPEARYGPDILRQAAVDEVERSLWDPGLSPALVADRVGVSVRYLHRLFSDHGPTFGRWLLERRLVRARAHLGDPEHAAASIAEIARRHGFPDASYFARAYRGRFAESPRDTRLRVGVTSARRHR